MESISLLVQSPLFLRFSGPIIVITLVSLFWWRAGSIHSIFDRLWRLVAGRAEVQDPALQAFIQQNRDLEKFRFIYGLKVEKQSDLHRLLSWIDDSPFNIARLQKVRRWVDVRSEGLVVDPPKMYFFGKLALAIACFLVILGASAAMSSPSAWLQMRQSQVWFSTDGNSVHGLFGRWSFDATVCDTNGTQVMGLTGFLDSEVASVCSAFRDGSLAPVVAETVKQQRAVAAVVGGIAVFLLIGSFFAVIAAGEAQRLRRLLDGKVSELPSAAKDTELGKMAEPGAQPRSLVEPETRC